MTKEIKSLMKDIQILHELSIKAGNDKALADWILAQQIKTFAKIDKLRDAENLRQREEFGKEVV